MAAGDGSELFLGNRLNDPLGYSNGMAGYLLVCFWPMVVVAERASNRALAGAGMAGATMLTGLAAMTQSRGATAAIVVSVFLLLLLIPRRVKRGWALLSVALALGACYLPLADIFAALPAGETLSDDVVAGLVVGLLWGAACRVGDRLRHAGRDGPAKRLFAVALAALAVLGAIALSLPFSDRADRVQEQYNAFTELRPTGDSTRLVTGGGNRYDYWRIAFDQFKNAPVRGIGAGNFDTTYYRERRTQEDIRNPHSVELQVLGETGAVGAVALLTFIVGVVAGIRARATSGRANSDPALAIAAGGAFLVWFVHASVDWLHLIPGLSRVVLCMAAALVAPSARNGSHVASRFEEPRWREEWRLSRPQAGWSSSRLSVAR